MDVLATGRSELTLDERMIARRALNVLIDMLKDRIVKDTRRFGADFCGVEFDREDIKAARQALSKL